MIFDIDSPIRAARQWWKQGDHPLDGVHDDGAPEGRVVRRNSTVTQDPTDLCAMCGQAWEAHGALVSTGQIVCPGDWLVEFYDGSTVVVSEYVTEMVSDSSEHGASCKQCMAICTPTTYDERAAWVGEHRVSTGHAVSTWGIK